MGRVVHILYPSTGGTGTFLINLREAENHHTHLIIAWGVEVGSSEFQDALKPEIIIHKKSGLDIKSWVKICRALDNLSPDLICLHSPTAWPAVYFYCYWKKIKYISLQHTPPGYESWTERIADKLIAKTASEIICFSDKLSEIWKKNQGGKKPIVIPHRINENWWKQAPLLKQKGLNTNIIIGHHGRLIPRKRPEKLIELMLHLKEKNVRLEIVGEGPELNNLILLTQKHGLENQIIFKGELHQIELREWIQGLDLWIGFSLSETVSIATLEAICCGIECWCSGYDTIQKYTIDIQSLALGEIAYRIINHNRNSAQGDELRKKMIADLSFKEWGEKWSSLLDNSIKN
jgi:glycosyltransferase involved in cell wall biosynthesis